MTYNLDFDPLNRLIRIRPFLMTLVDATEGNDYIEVDEIDSNMPSSGWIALSKSKATIVGTNNLSNGYNFESDPRSFLIISGDGIDYEQILLDQDCSDASEIANLINSKLSQTQFATMVEAFTIDNDFIGLRQKDPQWGEVFSFVLDYGDPDALTILGISPGTQVGTSDLYSYSSWSGTRINLDSNLTRDYPTNVYCAAYYKTMQVQQIYNQVMDWCDDPVGMVHPVPMEGAGYYPLGGGMYTDKIYILKNGWKILPHCGNYRLSLIGTLITDDGSERVRLPRSGTVEMTFQVSSQGIIAYPMEQEISSINTRVQQLPTASEIDSQLSSTHGEGSWEGQKIIDL
ncbi:MAG: hypothetical protein DRP09_16375 [Candidatus Thorarchaeota archaeon]|nr:MAG: hypothetical protein DRP09_16375 [Candidatus Thorarchaeota archaeon]